LEVFLSNSSNYTKDVVVFFDGLYKQKENLEKQREKFEKELENMSIPKIKFWDEKLP